jgi:hypothetical protein
MKFVTLTIADNKIDIFNSWLGKETIKVNDEVVSAKHSLFGAEHQFRMQAEGEEVTCRLHLRTSFYGVVFDLFVNDKPVVESSKSGCMTTLAIFIFIGAVIGILNAVFDSF